MRAIVFRLPLTVALLGISCGQPSGHDRPGPSDQRRAPEAFGPHFVGEASSQPSADPGLRIGLTTGQQLYVPVYSHVYRGSTPKPLNLA